MRRVRPNHEGPSVTDSAIEATGAERSLSLTDILAEAERRLLVEQACLTPAEVLALQALSDERLGDLADLAHRVRVEYCGDAVDVESIISAKTGGCPEDCAFCSQSSRFPTEVAPTGYLSHKELLRAAEETQQRGASEFCIVMALRGPDQRTMDYVAGAVELLRRETDLNVACSLGLLTRQQAVELASVGVHRYNHNLETCRGFFPKICTTHTWEERRETCKLVKEVGMQLCTGGIIGMGETPKQRVEFAFELAELDPHEVPVNFLNPRPGTPLGDRPILDVLLRQLVRGGVDRVSISVGHLGGLIEAWVRHERDYGIPIVTEEHFARMIGSLQPPVDVHRCMADTASAASRRC